MWNEEGVAGSPRPRTRKPSPRSGLLLVLSAPSGCGKTTVIQELLKRDKILVRSVSWTTRSPRPGEKHRKDYFFVTRKKFLAARDRGGFLEWAKVYREYYGTPRSFVKKALARSRDVVLVIDTRGARKVRRQMPCVLVFLKPPSLAVLKKRLFKRNSDSKSQIESRLKEVRYELNQAGRYDYRVVNHTVAQTLREIREIIWKERRIQQPWRTFHRNN